MTRDNSGNLHLIRMTIRNDKNLYSISIYFIYQNLNFINFNNKDLISAPLILLPTVPSAKFNAFIQVYAPQS